jgi:gas vesicle protein
MKQQTNINSILLATTSFIGGVAVGLLLAPKSGDQNRTWLLEHTTKLTKWLDSQHRIARKTSSKELHRFRKNVQQGIRRNVPDLYEATEDIDLSDNDVLSE